MNLKEAYRCQRFLSDLMDSAAAVLQSREHATTVTKNHLCHAVNPDKEDFIEPAAEEQTIPPNDTVALFMRSLITEREKLSIAIAETKHSLPFNIDAAIEANKFRQSAIRALRGMLRFTPSTTVMQGRGYKFNNEGNQMPYIYDIEVKTDCRFDVERTKRTVRELAEESDRVSAEIDAALVNSIVNYKPRYDVNSTFEDVVCAYAAEGF